MSITSLTSFFSKGNYEEYLKTIDKTVKIDVSDPNYKIFRYNSLLHSGYYIKLLHELNVDLNLKEQLSVNDLLDLLFLKCEILEKLSNDSEGIKVIFKIKELIPKLESADKDYIDFLDFKTEIFEGLFNYSSIFVSTLEKKIEVAIDKISTDKNRNRLLSHYFIRLGIIARKKNLYNESISYFQKAFVLFPDNLFSKSEIEQSR